MNLSIKKLSYIFLAQVLILITIIFFKNFYNNDKNIKVIFPLEENLASIILENMQDRIELSKTEDSWRISKPFDFDANVSQVNKIINLSRSNVDRLISASKNARKRFNTSEKNFEKKITFISENLTKEIYISNSDVSKQVYISFDKNPEVFTVSKSFFEIPVTEKEIINRAKFSISTNEISSILVEFQKMKASIIKSDESTNGDLSWKFSEDQYSPSLATDIIAELSTLEFESIAKKEPTGLINQFTISVDKGGPKSSTLVFFTGSEKKFFLKSSNYPNLFFLMTEFRYESMYEFIKKLEK